MSKPARPAPLVSTVGVEKVYPGGSSVGRFLTARGGGTSSPYDSVAALRGVTLALATGEFTALAGPSGSGKSTLLNVIGTLDRPTKGTVSYEGRVVSGLDAAALSDFRLRALGFVFQAYNLIPVLTAAENVEYPLILRGMEAGQRRKSAREALRAVSMDGYADRRPDLLSGGQQQRVAIARAIVHRPSLVLADEPTANLDSKTGAQLLDLMERLNQNGVTFLFSSHDSAVLERARRVVRLQDGELLSDEVRAR